jgi:hypothetical protein
MNIPSKIENDIWAGKCVYRTAQFGAGGQTILPIGNNQYGILFGYSFSPAGGGFSYIKELGGPAPEGPLDPPVQMLPFGTQQISFFTGDDFFPFVENVPLNTNLHNQGANDFQVTQVDNSPITRSLYIRMNQSTAVSVGLISELQGAVSGTIPVTQSTPINLTYGGSPQAQFVQTDLGGSPVQFLQPVVQGWDRAPYAYGVIPGNASNQLFATPDAAAGLIEPSGYVASLGLQETGATYHYYITLYYALYNAASDSKLQ